MKNKFNLLLTSVLIILIVIGFWGDKVILFLTNAFFINFYPQLVATFIGIILGIPAGLFLNRLVEKSKNEKIIGSILTFIKAELESNKRNVENLQEAAEKIISLQNSGQEDLKLLGKFTTTLKQDSYIAAQSSVAFASISNDRLINSIVNSYLNIHRLLTGAVSMGDIEPDGKELIITNYIKLCERTKESIRRCFQEIDNELKRLKIELSISD